MIGPKAVRQSDLDDHSSSLPEELFYFFLLPLFLAVHAEEISDDISSLACNNRGHWMGNCPTLKIGYITLWGERNVSSDGGESCGFSLGNLTWNNLEKKCCTKCGFCNSTVFIQFSCDSTGGLRANVSAQPGAFRPCLSYTGGLHISASVSWSSLGPTRESCSPGWNPQA